jgi:coatomer subunit gamma
LKITEIEVDS